MEMVEINEMLNKYVGMDFVMKLFNKIRIEELYTKDDIERGFQAENTPGYFVFAGNPGTGKKTVGKLLGTLYNKLGVLDEAEILLVDASELIGTYIGETAEKTHRIMQKAINNKQLLYIDEAYQLFECVYGCEAVNTVMDILTENTKDLKVVFSMYSDKVESIMKINLGFQRRLRIVEFPDYTPVQLLEIFDRIIASENCTITDEARERVKLIFTHMYDVRSSYFGNAHEVRKLVREMKKNNGTYIEKYQYELSDLPKEMFDMVEHKVNPKSLEDIMKELDEYVGMSELKNIIISKKEEIMYARQRGEDLDNIRPGYYFFMGNPGTGKTMGAKLLAKYLYQMGVIKTNNFYACVAENMIGDYVGETQEKVLKLLKKSINGVLFIDEAYSLSYVDRQHGGTDYFRKEAVETIISFMSIPEHRKNCCIIFAGYENYMQELYKASSSMRSRIEEVHFRDYSSDELYDIFEQLCYRNGFKLSEGIRDTYIPIFEKLKNEKYFSNARDAHIIFTETIQNVKQRIVRAESVEQLDVNVILKEDLLTFEDVIKA